MKRTVENKYGPGIIILTSLLIVGLYSSLGYFIPPQVVYLATAIAVISIGIAYTRGGLEGYPFWVTIITAYPTVTPFIVNFILGFRNFSGRALEFQDNGIIAEPLIIAALTSLFMSVAITKKTIKLKDYIVENVCTRNMASVTWLFGTSLAVLFFSWLTEPGPPIGIVSYTELRTYRIPGTDFAGAAWAVCSVLNLAIYLSILNSSTENTIGISKWIFWVTMLVSILYLLSHARRSEVSGYLIFILFIFGPRMVPSKKLSFGIVVLALVSAIGYVRNYQTPISPENEHYVHLPGGSGNVVVGYVVAYELIKKGEISIIPGTTYLGHIVRIPPGILGLKRPPIAYDYVNNVVPLSGGEYYLIEPILNFGILGIVFYLIIFVAIVNWTVITVVKYADEAANLVRFIIASTFLVMLFRTLWYGFGAVFKALIISIMIGFMIALIVQTVRGRIKHYASFGLE